YLCQPSLIGGLCWSIHPHGERASFQSQPEGCKPSFVWSFLMKLWKDHFRLIKHHRFAGVLSALLLAGCGGQMAEGPAPDKPKGQGGSREMPAEVQKSQEKLKRVGAAFHKDQVSFPLGYATQDGRLSLSWRVALLPKLGYEDLFKRFHLYEPWDSPHNLPLLA